MININKIGLYKVEIFGKFHRMRVYREGEKLMYSIGALPPKCIEEIDPDANVIKEIQELDPVLHPELILRWKDREFDVFEETGSSKARFRQILDFHSDVMARLDDSPWKT
jgi:hypothetical protein